MMARASLADTKKKTENIDKLAEMRQVIAALRIVNDALDPIKELTMRLKQQILCGVLVAVGVTNGVQAGGFESGQATSWLVTRMAGQPFAVKPANKARMQCDSEEVVVAMSVGGNPVSLQEIGGIQYIKEKTVDFLCLDQLGTEKVVTLVRRATLEAVPGFCGFRQAGPVKLEAANYFIFEPVSCMDLAAVQANIPSR